VKLLSVNVSRPKPVPWHGQTVLTGIFKAPVAGRVRLGRLNLDGDGQADLQVHGGPDKAVYAYPAEHYAAWAAELGRDDLRPGQFGENFTVGGLREDAVRLGDVFRVGTAVVAVTQPRMPCYKLGIRMGEPMFPRRFLRSGRPGVYFRVEDEGEVGAGDEFELLTPGPDDLTVWGLWHLTFFEPENVEGARRALRHTGLGPEWRERLQERVFEADRG
jgi:MOSC domain-containing protein YiiM